MVDIGVEGFFREQAAVVQHIGGLRHLRIGVVGGFVEADILEKAPTMKRATALDDRKALGQLAQGEDVLSLFFRRIGHGVGGIGIAKAPVVHPDSVAHLAAEQLVHWNAGVFARDVPKRHFNSADDFPPRLKRARSPDAAHDEFHVRRIAAQNQIPVVGDSGSYKVLALLHFGVAIDALIGDHADDDVAADNRALDIGDFHVVFLFN